MQLLPTHQQRLMTENTAKGPNQVQLNMFVRSSQIAKQYKTHGGCRHANWQHPDEKY